jgi:hypothetical protein
MSIRVVAILVVAIWTAACVPEAVRYARARHPGCQVEPVAARGDAVTVRVACPNADPVERTYRGGR